MTTLNENTERAKKKYDYSFVFTVVHVHFYFNFLLYSLIFTLIVLQTPVRRLITYKVRKRLEIVGVDYNVRNVRFERITVRWMI